MVEFVRRRIEAGELKPGDQLPPERQLAEQMGVSRPSLRSGLRSLQAMGVVRARQGSGTFVTDGPPRLSDGPLRFLVVETDFVEIDGRWWIQVQRATPEFEFRNAAATK